MVKSPRQKVQEKERIVWRCWVFFCKVVVGWVVVFKVGKDRFKNRHIRVFTTNGESFKPKNKDYLYALLCQLSFSFGLS